MKLSELIEELQEQLQENGDLNVMTSSDYGDYSHTEQLSEIEQIEVCEPEDSAYSNSGLAYPDPRNQEEEEDEEEFTDPEVQRRYEEKTHKDQVLVLRYTSR